MLAPTGPVGQWDVTGSIPYHLSLQQVSVRGTKHKITRPALQEQKASYMCVLCASLYSTWISWPSTTSYMTESALLLLLDPALATATYVRPLVAVKEFAARAPLVLRF